MKKEEKTGYSGKRIPDSAPESKFAGRLKEQMEKKNMTQVELSHQMNVSVETVKKWCQGYTFPKGLNMGKLCEIFSPCSADYFHGTINAPNWDIQNISNTVGLSPAAISSLIHMNENSKLIVSNIIEESSHDGSCTAEILILFQAYIALYAEKIRWDSRESERIMKSFLPDINRKIENLLNELGKKAAESRLYQDFDSDNSIEDMDVPF